jgi:hypothetical protein
MDGNGRDLSLHLFLKRATKLSVAAYTYAIVEGHSCSNCIQNVIHHSFLNIYFKLYFVNLFCEYGNEDMDSIKIGDNSATISCSKTLFSLFYFGVGLCIREEACNCSLCDFCLFRFFGTLRWVLYERHEPSEMVVGFRYRRLCNWQAWVPWA